MLEARHARAQGGQQEHDPLGRRHPHAHRKRRPLVISDGLQRRPQPRAQQQEQRQRHPRHHHQPEPVGVIAPRAGVEAVERQQRGAGRPLHDGVEADEQLHQSRQHPHANGEFAATQLQHEAGQPPGQQPARRPAQRQRRIDRHARRREPDDRIGAKAEEHLLAHRDEPAIASQRVPGDGQDDIDKQRGEVVDDIARNQRRSGQQQHEQGAKNGGAGHRTPGPALYGIGLSHTNLMRSVRK